MKPACITCGRAVKVPRRGMCRRCHIDDLTARRADGPIAGRIGVPLIVRLADSFEHSEDGCWLWSRQLNNKGYGLISVRNHKRAAHVVMWEETVGPVPEGLQLDHLCRVRRCVNPDHLEPVTHAENQRRGYAARRQAAS